MSSQNHIENDRQSGTGGRENRGHLRKSGKAAVEVTRERDRRRILLTDHLVDISVNGIGLIAADDFVVGDGVKILLRNDARRYSKQVYGVVRWLKPTPSGDFQVGILLHVWFTPHDMQVITQSGFNSASGQKLVV